VNTGDKGDTGTRVALLARAGTACERLQVALQQAGADIVLVADPADSDAATVRAAGAQAILIALEPLVDESLDRYDALLADPGVTVIFDEAELASHRDGWDAARWVRHLAAKLNRHQEVLPPGAEADASAAPAIAAPIEPVPLDTPAASAQVDASFDITFPELDVPTVHAGSQPVPADMSEPDFGDLSAFLDEIASGLPVDAATATVGDETDVPHPFDPVMADFDFDFELDADPNAGIETDTDTDASASQTFDAPHASAPSIGGLVEAPADEAATAQTEKADNERFRLDLDALHLRIADMQLEDVRPARPVSHDGAVLVMAGIGGPDAVRQLLAGLPASFPRAVLIQQRLEGARHDNLVRQMQRATAMPVHLAEAGGAFERGHVYILPTGMGVGMVADGLRFSATSEALASLPAADSAMILLSGAEPNQVDAVFAHGVRGALVAGQSPDGCFDAAASDALVARGGSVAAPAEIARQLATRWPN
jgi:chemosensory pili system protein ChpB (putative protein-glutamate methylesterase)